MAITQFGGGITQMRGSVGGSTFTRTKAGAITRQRVKPTNPQTTFQMDQRSIITELATAWGQTLTQAQRDSWSAFGVAYPTTNKIGESVQLTGNQAFSRAGAALMAAGSAYIVAAPASMDVAELQTLTLTADIGAGNFEAAWTSTGTLTVDKLCLLATPGLSPGISSISNRLRRVSSSAADPTSPTAIEATYLTRFGALPLVGQKVTIRAFFIRTTTGAVSSMLESSAIVVSTV